MSQTAVQISNVTVKLSRHFEALKNITTELEAGKITGFIGPSGAGKTTLMRAIVGRQKLTKGTIKVLEFPAGAKALRRMVNYMTQEVSVCGDLTVTENLSYFAAMVGIKRTDRHKEIEHLLSAVGLQSNAHQLVNKLSGGQKQRVSLAITLLGKPQLMVLDEPTVGLDPVLREQLWELFRSLANQGVTVIISSHVMDEAERCDELLLLRDGKLLATGSPGALCKQTHTQTVEQSFLKLVKEAT